jgi:hypothetical protein
MPNRVRVRLVRSTREVIVAMAPINEQEFTDFTGLTEEERQRLHEKHKNDPPVPHGVGGYKTKVHPPVVPRVAADQPPPAPPSEADE